MSKKKGRKARAVKKTRAKRPTPKKGRKSAIFLKRSKAAKKVWALKRLKQAQRATAARKGWQTRKRAAVAAIAAEAKQKRSQAAREGWQTRRKKAAPKFEPKDLGFVFSSSVKGEIRNQVEFWKRKVYLEFSGQTQLIDLSPQIWESTVMFFDDLQEDFFEVVRKLPEGESPMIQYHLIEKEPGVITIDLDSTLFNPELPDFDTGFYWFNHF
jgi:hypothetical protein